MPPPGEIAWFLAAVAACSVALSGAALAYARRRALLDVPGRRRSHSVPTPRGGGVGAIAVMAVATAWLGLRGMLPEAVALGFVAGLLAVAAIGWLDDHRPVPARWRFAVHVAAAAVMGAVLVRSYGAGLPLAPWLAGAAAVFWLAGTINAWNFMDGIDGLVATQSVWVACCATVAFGLQGDAGWTLAAGAVACATIGFLPFNFPRARIFMGDVASGGLGFACGALLVAAVARDALSPWAALLVASALLFDAGLTLAHRIYRGRRWYTAHREHLYQWLVRSGLGHARTTLLYLTWNLLVVLPLLALASARPAFAPFALLVAAAGAWWLWHGTKRAMLARAGTP
jgi:UDP-N-acetylmuramyl pentapeptide phosphotransferase/UDP-N-acetylglucosamine-1-phosphate transferase